MDLNLKTNQTIELMDTTARNMDTESQDDEPHCKQAFERKPKVMRSPVLPRGRCLARTPPRGRTHSLPEMENGSSSKRKRVEFSPKSDKDIICNAELLKETISLLSGQVTMFEGVLMDSYKPKKEYVEICSKLGREIQKLKSENFNNWLEMISKKEDNIEEELRLENDELRQRVSLMQKENENDISLIEELRKENRNLKSKMEMLEEQNRTGHEQNHFLEDKCKECLKVQRRKSRRAGLKKSDNFAGFQAVTEQDWEMQVFDNPIIMHGLLWDAPTEVDFILPCDKNLESDHKGVNRCIGKLGGKEGLKKQNKKEGEVAIMMHALGFPNEEGTFTNVMRCIYYPVLTKRTTQCDSDDEILFRALEKTKSLLLGRGSRRVAIPEMEDITGLMVTRMLQFILADTPIELSIYRPQKEKIDGVHKKQSGNGKNSAGAPGRVPPTRPKRDALLVSMKGKSYADLFKEIKTAVNPRELGVEIQNMRKTKNGELLLTIQNGADKADVLRKELKNRVPEANTSLLVRRKILHLKDMNEMVNEDEIRDAVSKTLGVAKDQFEVRALRPAYGGKQNATLKMLEADAIRLIQAGTIGIGWTRCKVVERMQIVKCTKCWEIGHIKSECKGPDRSLLCMKCGQPGHKVSICQSEPFCLNCNSSGHRTGSNKCKVNTECQEKDKSLANSNV